MVPSANDAAETLAIGIDGSEAAFVRRMNRTAKELGMTDTVYKRAVRPRRRGPALDGRRPADPGPGADAERRGLRPIVRLRSAVDRRAAAGRGQHDARRLRGRRRRQDRAHQRRRLVPRGDRAERGGQPHLRRRARRAPTRRPATATSRRLLDWGFSQLQPRRRRARGHGRRPAGAAVRRHGRRARRRRRCASRSGRASRCACATGWRAAEPPLAQGAGDRPGGGAGRRHGGGEDGARRGPRRGGAGPRRPALVHGRSPCSDPFGL